jgi:hypothetical protein
MRKTTPPPVSKGLFDVPGFLALTQPQPLGSSEIERTLGLIRRRYSLLHL